MDTDILIWLLRGREDIKIKFIKVTKETEGSLYITPIQIAEIYAGLKPKEKEFVEKFIDSFYLLEINAEVGKLAGEFMNKYRKSHSVEIADALIAAVVKINSCKLWTLNKKHYPMLTEEEFFG